ncbi:hypothetical protein F7731_05570 [Cytobacillus depressus]|uniref:DUF3993 domain-containing protein n=1 Tax=Cytobacillus depressus TaxID=1602942 RepID=A0A6L3V8G7_9BACI|nr:hypothetical protein [Cytobacillus depressus]KAB2337095.1 hypothetical protein F7731_05570 [Cytobacillus depressus]
MKKLIFYLGMTFVLFFTAADNLVLALSSDKQEIDCAEKKDMRNKAFNEAIMKDIFSSFGHKYDEIVDQSMYLNFIDLMKYTVVAGKRDSQIESLKEHLSGESLGEKRIYFFHGNPDAAYIFYKDLEHQNIAIHLEESGNAWIVKDKKVERGKKIPFIREKCEDDYFMKRMFNNLYQK